VYRLSFTDISPGLVGSVVNCHDQEIRAFVDMQR